MSPLKTSYKIIFVTGGVVSSVGKGILASSLAALLKSRGYRVSLMKCDPYLNVDPGTMNPYQHGEVYVLEDGAETDLDLGHYERFTGLQLTKDHSVTAGQIYESIISKERRGDYLGKTVQVVPHVTSEIQSRILKIAKPGSITIVEIGGTVGDIEGLPFLEAIRQLRYQLPANATCFIHVTFVPYIKAAQELKSKPTQHSVKALREIGIEPDFIVCRTEYPLDDEFRLKTALHCSLPKERVIEALDATTIYQVPLLLHKERLDKLVLEKLGLRQRTARLAGWRKINKVLEKPSHKIIVGLVGKYVHLRDSYKSLHEALVHAGIALNAKVQVEYIDSESIEPNNLNSILNSVHGVIIPGGFGIRGVHGKLLAVEWLRENQKPLFGICYGMQIMVVEFARHICGLKNAVSREWVKNGSSKSYEFIIDWLPEQMGIKEKGGTMRLGAYLCELVGGTLAQRVYGKRWVMERHRHRYEVNNHYRETLIKKGLIISGVNPERNLVEIVELPNHPWFLGVQFHPEFKSRPLEPHPLFVSFLKACLQQS